MIALNISLSYEYQSDVFDCKHFSYELTNTLRRQGYDARFVVGKALWCEEGWFNGEYNYCGHAWVQLRADNVTYNIEAISGEILSEDKYHKNYRMYWSTPCLKCMKQSNIYSKSITNT